MENESSKVQDGRALALRTKARLTAQHAGGRYPNHYEAEGHLTTGEVYMIQAALGYEPQGYGCFSIRHLVDPILLTPTKTIWKSAGSCE